LYMKTFWHMRVFQILKTCRWWGAAPSFPFFFFSFSFLHYYLVVLLVIML
jgi:hypothetical protein